MGRILALLELLLSLSSGYRHQVISLDALRLRLNSSRSLPQRSARPAARRTLAVTRESTDIWTNVTNVSFPWDKWEMPTICDGHTYSGPINFVGNGAFGIALSLLEESEASHTRNARVVKIPLEEYSDLANECVFMKFLEYQGVENVLRCEAKCEGKISADGETREVTQIITHPFVVDAESSSKNQTALKNMWHTAVSMLAAGCVNPDIAGNILYSSDSSDKVSHLFIDLGMATLILSGNETPSQAMKLFFDEFRFFPGSPPYKTAAEVVENGLLGLHIRSALSHLVDMQVGLLQDGWTRAWNEAASNRKYEPPGLDLVAEEIFHGVLLLHSVGIHKDRRNMSTKPSEVFQALQIGTSSGHAAKEFWSKCKEEALDHVENLLKSLTDAGAANDTRITDAKSVLELLQRQV